MEKSFSRSSKISQELQKTISIIIQYFLRDPRFKTIITISEVVVSTDLSYAQVFFSCLEIDNKLSIKKLLTSLNKASGYIRKLLCKKLTLRIIPKIVFYHDDSFIKGNRISLLLNQLTQKKILSDKE
ncbi:ribosome-binding factor A [Buchnera aphidicola (Aphis glycines)]|uniref:Ribosome-binding factor A n=1 Tax=Buchnera aphidicola (Aphis glycines) TaxID=1265350 RepID=A0A0M3RSJ5_9GAMM|nr:30S ribosome-binding factor RbfA [Buchnera aphidicola]ALD15316.1 ribosome-binding factor A [Buchnera aphidicola (Aphis glycines)]